MDKIINTTEILAFEIINAELKFTNKTEIMLELKSYYPSLPIYDIVLNFIFDTGGVF